MILKGGGAKLEELILVKKFHYDNDVEWEYCTGEFFVFSEEEADQKIAKELEQDHRYQGFSEGQPIGWYPQFVKKKINHFNP